MNDTEKLAMLKVLVDVDDDTQDSALTVYLQIAGSKILSKAFPYDSSQTEVPARYSFLQCEIAAYLWNKRGAEGQTVHTENGITRQYGSADVPNSMLREVVPFCGTLKGAVSS